jgi:hypothetical protein
MKMKKWVMGGVVGCLLLGLSTCDRSGPTMPRNLAQPVNQADGQSGVTAGGILVASSRVAYFVGETETFAASQESGGGTIPITDGTWATDTPGVATVNDAGLVTIVGQGFANITCTRGSMTGSKQIWGRVDCRGAWSGTYSIQRCELWGDFPDPKFCETHGGSGLPIGLVLTQEGEVLQGTIKLGGISIPFVAKPLLDGALEMEGEFFSDPYVINFAVGCDWTPSGPSFCMMLYYYKGDRGSGQAMLTCDISLSKTGAWQ